MENYELGNEEEAEKMAMAIRGRKFERIGTWIRTKKSWREELSGLYITAFDTSTCGGGGAIWKIIYKGKVFYTVSTGGSGITPGWDKKSYILYRHFVLNREGIKRLPIFLS